MPVKFNDMDSASDNEVVTVKEENDSEDEESLPDDDESTENDEESNFFEKLENIESKKRKHQTGGNEDDVEEPGKTKKKKKKADINVKPPTAEEMSRLRETENLFHSNLFRLQIEEMIKEVRPKKYERKSMKQWLDKLSQFLLAVNDVPDLTTDKLEGYLLPIFKIPRDIEIGFNFLKPTSVDIQGSYRAGCCLGPSLAVDVFVTIPKKCFLKTDYLNGIYYYKRALYLAQLAKFLDEHELLNVERGLEYCNKLGDPSKPVLVLHPAGNVNKVEVFVHVVPEEGRFKLNRFLPDKCNVKFTWWARKQKEGDQSATPHYNNTFTEDLVVSVNETLRHEVLEANPNLKEAITLFRVWLRQRELDKGYGSFNGYIASMYVIYLFRCRRLNTFMSSYQIVRNVWLALGQTDWSKEGISLSTAKEDTVPSLHGFHQHYEVVFVDVTGYCNLTARMSKLTFIQVKEEAALAIQYLDNPHMNSFNALFMTPMPFLRQFDHIIKITNKKAMRKLADSSSLAERLDTSDNITLLASQVITGLFQRAMEHRLSLMAVKLDEPIRWNVKKVFWHYFNPITIGLRLNSDTALSVIDKGPPANLPEAADFRDLWGTKSELRRFKDGNVCEAVIWAEPGVSIAERRLIVKNIAVYLLTKLGVNQYVVYIADQLEPLIHEKYLIPDGFDYGTGEECAWQVIEAYDKLAKQLREMTDLPLDISSIQGVSPLFRFCDVFPPLACYNRCLNQTKICEEKSCLLLKDNLNEVPRYTSPVEVVIQLGLSRKWPENVEAVRRVRAAFNLQIAKSLGMQCNLQAQVFPDYVDVAKDGFVFRIRVAYAREVVLMKEITTPDGKTMYRDTPESLELERATINLPKLSGALYGLSQQCLGYGPATCLAKRWLHSQMFNSALFPDIATELLMAYLFISPEPFRAVIQPQTGFLRFLNLLATTNWYLEPIIVSFNSDLKREDILEIESYFRTERTSLPPLFIATQYDRTGSLWTKQAPILPVLAWLTKVAAESLRTLESRFLTSEKPEDCKQIFRPPMHIYDAFIRLRPCLSPLHSYGVDYKSKDLPVKLKVPKDKNKLPIVGFDPVQRFLSELREHYGEFALFFHNTYGGDVIGVLFKPSALEKHEFKVSHMNCRMPVEEGTSTMLSLNIDALFEDFYFLGKDLVQTIERRLKDNT